MKRRLALLVLLALGGCAPATTPAASATTAAAVASEADQAQQRADALAELTATNRELTVQLGLARAETSELQDEIAALREDEARRVTRIASQPPPSCEEHEAEPVEAEPSASDPRPVLRLYGTGPAPVSSRPAGTARGVAAMPGPDSPSWVGPPPAGAVRLPVIATRPGDPSSGVPAIPIAPVQVRGNPEPAPVAEAGPAPSDSTAEQYRSALRHLTQSRIPEASAGLDRFVAEHPGHPYADNAMYWRAEIDYTRRDYSAALSRFSRLIERFPRGNKVPDALLRIGLCYERMGQRSRARRVFSRLRQQYPNTVAARMASREDA